MGVPGAVPPLPHVPLAEQIAAVERRASVAIEPRIARAMDAAVATLKDYQAMQPKVLALTAVSLALAKGLKISQEALDEMLVKAEADAVHQMGGAPTPPVTLLVESDAAKAVVPWPFTTGRRP